MLIKNIHHIKMMTFPKIHRRLLFMFTMYFMTIFTSCKNQSETKPNNPPLYDEVMYIHDKVMPETSHLFELKNELKSFENPQNQAFILDKIKQLDDADEAMMAWMAAFKMPADTAATTTYLMQEKIKIQEVHDLIYKALADGQQVLDSLKLIK